MPGVIKKLLIGTSIFAGVSAVSSDSVFAATFSEIPINAVNARFSGPPISTSPLTLGFQVSVSDTLQLNPDLRLISFTARLVDQRGTGFVFGLNGQPAPGWQASGGMFEALSPEEGIAPGASLGGFAATTSASAPSFLASRLDITSVSSTQVPEPSSTLLNTLAFGAFLGTGIVLKRKLKKQKSASRDKSVV